MTEIKHINYTANRFKKGDPIYFYSKKHGTVPATVLKVGRTHPNRWTKFQGMLFIAGNFPNYTGTTNVWVHAKNCNLQKDTL